MKHILFLLLTVASVKAIGQTPIPNTLTSSQKVYGLSKFWQEANYNFIYLNRVNRKAWDSAYVAAITTVQNTPNDYEYYRELQKFCALLKDGHTNVYFPRGIEQMNTMFGTYRFFIENVGGKPIITRTNESRKEEIPVGSEVIEVNGLPAPRYIETFVAPYISSSTDYVLQDIAIARMLQGLEGQAFDVKIKRPKGDIVSLHLVHSRTTEEAVYPPFEPDRQLLELKWYPKDVAYLALNSFGDPKIDTMFYEKLPELYKAKALIIDLRNNGGGSTNIGTDILRYLTNDTILYGARNTSRLHIPSFKAWGKYVTPADTARSDWNKRSWRAYNDLAYYYFDYEPDTVHLTAKRLVVPTIILTGHNTASAAEDFLIYADNQKHMKRMGADTYGSTGQPFVFDLPGGGQARICTKQDTYPDGREFVGYGIHPHTIVIPTLNDYLQRRDVVLEKALASFK